MESSLSPQAPAFNPWPYSLIAFFTLLISAVLGFAIFAIRQPIDLVRPDYYEADLQYQDHLDTLRRTHALAIPVAVALDPTAERLTISLPATHATLGARGTVELYRPSDARLDRTLPLTVDAEGRQRMSTAAWREGLWKVRVAWQVGDSAFHHTSPVIVRRTR